MGMTGYIWSFIVIGFLTKSFVNLKKKTKRAGNTLFESFIAITIKVIFQRNRKRLIKLIKMSCLS